MSRGEKQVIFILLGIPSICVVFPFWLIIGIVSSERLGRVLEKTGEGILKITDQ